MYGERCRGPVLIDMQWQRGLSVLAREELVHFERALKLLSRRRIPFRPQVSVVYATKLQGPITTDMPARLIDELLTAAIIEAPEIDASSSELRAMLQCRDKAASRFLPAPVCDYISTHDLYR